MVVINKIVLFFSISILFQRLDGKFFLILFQHETVLFHAIVFCVFNQLVKEPLHSIRRKFRMKLYVLEDCETLFFCKKKNKKVKQFKNKLEWK